MVWFGRVAGLPSSDMDGDATGIAGKGRHMYRTAILGLLLFVATASAATPKADLPAAANRPGAERKTTLLPTPQFRRFGLFNYLPSSTVLDVAQDHEGFLWIGTDVGLVRYDGVDFDSFTHDPADPSSLSANHVSTILVDRGGALWVGGNGTGLNRYDPKLGGFRHWREGPGDNGLPGNDVTAIAQTLDGAVWVALGEDGLARMAVGGRRFERLSATSEDVRDKVGSLWAGTEGSLWIGSATGLRRRRADGSVQPVLTERGQPLPAVNGIEGDKDAVRVGTERGLYLVGADGIARREQRVAEDMHVLTTISDKAGRLWVGTTNGLQLIDRDGRTYVIAAQPLMPGGLPGRQVRKIFADRENGLWFAFKQGGLAYLGPNWNAMSRFTHIPDDPASLPESTVTALAASADRRLWVGGEGWLRKLDPSNGKIEAIDRQEGFKVTALLEDRRGRLWIGGADGLYLRTDGTTRRIGEKLLHGPVTELLEDRTGHVYAASAKDNAIVVFHTSTLAAEALRTVAVQGELSATRQLIVHDNGLWRASDVGLSRRDAVHSPPQFVSGVSKGPVDAIAFDDSGFWLARPEVLEYYLWDDKRAVAVRHRSIGRPSGLPMSNIVSLRINDDGGIWLFGASGLWRYSPERNYFRKYSLSDGLYNREFNAGRSIETDDRIIYATTYGGLVALRTHENELTPAPAPLITALDVRRDGVMYPLSRAESNVLLRWDDRELRVRVRSLSYKYSSLQRYRFKVRGVDDDWVETGQRGEREIASLKPGKYLLDIEANAQGDGWTSVASPLTIVVESPPWLRWWAWLGYLALALLALTTVARAFRRGLRHRLRIQSAEHERALAEATSEAKSRFMATLGHEIRTPMTGILGMAELLQQTSLTPTQRGYVEGLQRSGNLLLRLVNDVLDLSRIDACRLELDPAPFDPRALVDEVVRLLSTAAARKKLSLVDDYAADLPACVFGDANRVEQVLLNLLGNAVKFTEHGGASVRVERCDGGLTFTVADTGPGISEEVQRRLFERFEQGTTPQREFGTGLGLAICRELVVLMGGRIWLDSRAGHGSRFHVWLPLGECLPDGPAGGKPVLPASKPSCIDPLDVLLVEDDPIVAVVISGMLEVQGHHVRHVAHSLGALTELAVTLPDVVLLDLDLPGIDGFQLAGMIRRLHGEASLPIYAVTARSVGDEEALVQAVGMDGFLRKPVNGEQLARLLASCEVTCRVS
jgi:signal transduction histidine kinase/ligand-binding sensor domain-containing protein/CheY-like chemotaxis protein